jgi:hypothetical protein
LASILDLPLDELPAMCDNLQLTSYFLDQAEDDSRTTRTSGRWLDDHSSAFYTAMYLRAAEHSIRLGCPMLYS